MGRNRMKRLRALSVHDLSEFIQRFATEAAYVQPVHALLSFHVNR